MEEDTAILVTHKRMKKNNYSLCVYIELKLQMTQERSS